MTFVNIIMLIISYEICDKTVLMIEPEGRIINFLLKS